MSSAPSPLEAALHYASQYRLAVFPAAVQPFRPLVEGGCRSATLSLEKINQLWAQRPDAGVAIATGAISGVIVVDIDNHEGGMDGRASLRPFLEKDGWPPTWIAHTPSGGQHIYFRDPGLGLTNRVGFLPGVDLRSDGGAVAAPPSCNGDKVYRWFAPPGVLPLADPPQWLLELLTQPAQRRASPRNSPLRLQSTSHRVAYITAVLQREYDRVAKAPTGTRNPELFKAACRLGSFIPALLSEAHAVIALEQAAEACGLVADDGIRPVRATIRSGLIRGMQNPREIG